MSLGKQIQTARKAKQLSQAALAGTVFMGGVTEAGEDPAHPALQETYRMGHAL